MSFLQFQPLIPTALWLALAALAAVVVGWYGWRRPAAIGPRRWLAVMTLAGAGLALTLLILLNPTWLEPLPPPAGKPLVTILIDRSASMAVADQPEGRSRLAAAADLAADLERELSRTFDVQVRAFAETATAVSPEQLKAARPDGQMTDLASAVVESLDAGRSQGQALVVLSDGIHNAPSGASGVLEAAQTCKAMSAPIFATPIGGQAVSDDLELSLARQQELAFIGQKTPLRVSVVQRGNVAAQAEVLLLDVEGKELDRKSVALSAAGAASATFQVAQPAVGLHRYEVRIEQQAGEATAANNVSTFLLRTIDRPIRVLLLEGKPYWDAKFLMRTLAHDASLEIDAVVGVSEGRYVKRTLRLTTAGQPPLSEGQPEPDAGGAPPPARREESTEIITTLPEVLESSEQLAQYQVVVLGRDAESFLSEPVLERLRMWISREGGSLVCFRGAPVAQMNQQLARLMPVRWTASPEARFRMQLTGRGQDLSWLAAAATGQTDLLARLPSLAIGARPERPTPLAVVAAESPGQSQPVVSYQPYGSGRVVAIEGAGMWRWAFLAPAHQSADPVYDSLWQGLMRWLVAGGGLAPGQTLALRSDRVSYFTEEPVAVTLLVREQALAGAPPAVELKRAGGATIGTFTPSALGDEPGVYRVTFGRLPEGRYEGQLVGQPADATEASIGFDVRPNFTEQLDTAAREDLLARMAEESDGAVLPQGSGNEVLRRFQEHLARNLPVQVRQITAWDRWWVLLTVVGLWGAAWAMRRSRGLV